MNPADKQGPNGTNGNGDRNPSGMQPSTPAFGASSSTSDPLTSGFDAGDAVSTPTMGAFNASATGGSLDASTGGTEKLTRIKEQATRLRGQATDRAMNAAEQGKTRATEAIDGVARAVHDAAGNLEQQVSPQVAQYAHRAADALDEISQSLRGKSVDQLLVDARNFARRSPAIAIGAAVAVGFALSRFLKATSAPPAAGNQRNAYALDSDDEDMPGMTTTRTVGGTQPRYNA